MIALLVALTWALNLLDRKALWPVGDLLARLCPREVALRHQNRAHDAALWLEAYEDDERDDDPRTAAHARLLLTLPWV